MPPEAEQKGVGRADSADMLDDGVAHFMLTQTLEERSQVAVETSRGRAVASTESLISPSARGVEVPQPLAEGRHAVVHRNFIKSVKLDTGDSIGVYSNETPRYYVMSPRNDADAAPKEEHAEGPEEFMMDDDAEGLELQICAIEAAGSLPSSSSSAEMEGAVCIADGCTLPTSRKCGRCSLGYCSDHMVKRSGMCQRCHSDDELEKLTETRQQQTCEPPQSPRSIPVQQRSCPSSPSSAKADRMAEGETSPPPSPAPSGTDQAAEAARQRRLQVRQARLREGGVQDKDYKRKHARAANSDLNKQDGGPSKPL
jgi:hypothetical protein